MAKLKNLSNFLISNMTQISHPVHDLGPEILAFAIGQMRQILDQMSEALAKHPAPPERTKRRLAMFTVLLDRYASIKEPLSAWCLATHMDEPALAQPEKQIKDILLPEVPHDEGTADLLAELSLAFNALLQRVPADATQAEARATGLPAMMNFYQISHSILMEFSKSNV